MNALATNTFAAVCFQKNAQFDFESLVAEFQQALDDNGPAPSRMRRVGGQFVSFDMGRAQLSLAYSSPGADRDSQHQASLAVYVGAGETSGKIMSPEERAGLCKGVLDRIEAVHPCDHRVWGETDRDILPLYSAAVEVAAPLAISNEPATPGIAPRRVRKLSTAGRRTRPATMANGADYADIQHPQPIVPAEPIRLTHPALYADRIKAARSNAPLQPRPLPRQVALGLPQTATRDLTILRNVFLTEPDAIEATATENPMAHRLAIYTLNTSLVVICLPIGAAMFSYCALGRENLNAVGRAMALTGIGIALAQSSVAATVLPLLG